MVADDLTHRWFIDTRVRPFACEGASRSAPAAPQDSSAPDCILRGVVTLGDFGSLARCVGSTKSGFGRISRTSHAFGLAHGKGLPVP